MKIDVRLLAFNEQEILPFMLEHYRTFADVITVYDGQSTDLTPDIARAFGCTVIPWDTGNQICDQSAMNLKDNEWKDSDADWFIFVDCDEMIYSPQMPMRDLLREYDRQQLAIIKTFGFEMASDVFPTFVPGRQIYDQVKFGATSDSYGKPALLNPSRLRETNYSAGAHGARPILANGRPMPLPLIPADPPCFCLHLKHLGAVERIIDEFTRDQSRLSPNNLRKSWGVYGDPQLVARNKREDINRRLIQVIP